MHVCRRALLAGLAATLLFTGLAGTAAGALSVNERAFRVFWPRFEVALQSEGEPRVARCPVTLDGSFHSSTFATTRSASVGNLTRWSVGTCTGGNLTILTMTLPWSLDFVRAAGVPLVVTMSYVNFSMQLSAGGLTCLTRATVGEPARGLWRVNETSRVTVDGDESINLPVTGIGCTGIRFAYEGPGLATRAGSTESLTMRTI